jgi:hypothetical protein
MTMRIPPPLNCRFGALALALVLLAGCRTLPAYVAVPEAVFRTEATACDRLPLPLDEAGRDFLFRFLEAGGDRDNLETGTGTDLGAAHRYSGLIALLSNSVNLELSEAPALSAAFKPWFPKPPRSQVIDAREAAPPVTQPLAYLGVDAHYWWVFYPADGQAAQLMVIKALRQTMER